jgi:hypothetical protein
MVFLAEGQRDLRQHICQAHAFKRGRGTVNGSLDGLRGQLLEIGDGKGDTLAVQALDGKRRLSLA